MLVQYAIDIRNFTIFMANPYQVSTGHDQTALWGLVLASSSSLLTKGFDASDSSGGYCCQAGGSQPLVTLEALHASLIADADEAAVWLTLVMTWQAMCPVRTEVDAMRRADSSASPNGGRGGNGTAGAQGALAAILINATTKAQVGLGSTWCHG